MKTLKTILALTAVLLGCSCNETFIQDPKGDGTLDFSRFTISRDIDVEVVQTKADLQEATGDYLVEIFNVNDESVWAGTYSDVKSTGYGVELKAGNYYVKVLSAEIPVSAFETPIYGAREDFIITAGNTTTLDPVTCTIQQCAATVSYDEGLLAMITGNGAASVEVTAGYPLSFAVNYSAGAVTYETRKGFFQVSSEPCTMVVTFSGSVDGKNQKMTKQFTDVKIGELRAIQFIKKVAPEGNVTFDIIVNTYVQDAELSANQLAESLEVIGEDPDAPKGDGGIKLEFAPDCTQYSDLNNIVVTPNGQPFDLRLFATVPNGVKSLKALIESTSKGFMDAVIAAGGPLLDLVNPSAESEIIFQVVPFPHGPELVGQTQVDFNLSSAQEPINLFPGEHTFTMKVVDQKGCKKDIAIKMIVQ